MLFVYIFFFFKQKTAYEMRISDWSSDVCSSDLPAMQRLRNGGRHIFCDLVEVPPVLHDDVRHRDVELLLDRHAELDPVEAVEIIALGRHRAALRGEDVLPLAQIGRANV